MDSVTGDYQAILEFEPATGRVAGSNPAEGTSMPKPAGQNIDLTCTVPFGVYRNIRCYSMLFPAKR